MVNLQLQFGIKINKNYFWQEIGLELDLYFIQHSRILLFLRLKLNQFWNSQVFNPKISAESTVRVFYILDISIIKYGI